MSTGEHRLTAAEREAYWRANRDRWRRLRAIAAEDAAPRPAIMLPDMREGAERLQRKRARKHVK